METVPQASGARLLGIHPKTLHHWLTAAHLPLAAHPTDARIKCVVQEHLLEVARRHGRPLPPLAGASRLSEASSPPSGEEPAKRLAAHEAEPAHRAVSLSAPLTLEGDLTQRLSHLETKISTRESTPRPPRSGAASGARANGRAAPRGPGSADPTGSGKASACGPARARGQTRAWGRLASRVSASCGRATSAVSPARFD